MRSLLVGAGLFVVGIATIVFGLLPTSAALAVANRTWPILLFVVAITVVTELASEAGLFRVLAERMTGWGRGRAILLWLLVVALATLSTVFLSLDTTAVLLTPVVVLLARHVGLPPLPFALTTVWLANTASLLLPVSNLTNLLAERELAPGGPFVFAAIMALPALVCVVVPCAVLVLLFRRQLFATYAPVEPGESADPVLLRWSAVVIAVLVPLLVSGLPVWVPATAAALVLGVVFGVRRRSVLRPGLIPWSLLLLAGGLFLVIEAGHAVGLTAVLAVAAGAGSGPGDLVRVAAVGAASANLANNLPAYLALEPVAGGGARLAALLVGVNAGPLITPWASLATLLWHARLVSLGVPVSWGRYALLGVLVVPLTIVPAALVLALVPGS